MPPKKLSKKEQLKLAKEEARLAQNTLDLSNFEEDETSTARPLRSFPQDAGPTSRELLSLQEQFEWSQLTCERLEEYADPTAALSVTMSAHKERERQLNERIEELQKQLEITRADLDHTTKAKEVLESELREVRADKRNDRDMLKGRMHGLEKTMLARLDEVVQRTMTDITEEREKAQQLYNQDLEETRKGFLGLIEEMKARAALFTGQLQEAKALHSNLPVRIRQRLAGMDHAELLTMIDTLSFEGEVLQYFMFRFPPEPDCPYAKGTASADSGIDRGADMRALTSASAP